MRREPGEVSAALASAATTATALHGFSDRLSWSHYRALTKLDHVAARRFYEIEAEREAWGVPQLERQIHSQLFLRLLKSRDKAGAWELATRGQVIERPTDVLKQPYVIDFLDVPEAHVLRESDLESALLEKLQHFLLELGKGFAFVARQKRVSFEDEQFYVDFVFYHCIPKCYLLIHLKLGKLTHQDVGKMDSYVRLFDDQCTTEGDAPTIGLILCAEKNETFTLAARAWRAKHLDWNRALLYVEPIAAGGLPRWQGQPVLLSRTLSQAVREVLVSADEPEAWSVRARKQLQQIRSEYGFLEKVTAGNFSVGFKEMARPE